LVREKREVVYATSRTPEPEPEVVYATSRTPEVVVATPVVVVQPGKFDEFHEPVAAKATEDGTKQTGGVTEISKCHYLTYGFIGGGVFCLFLFLIIGSIYVATPYDGDGAGYKFVCTIFMLAGLALSAVAAVYLMKQGQFYRKERGTDGRKCWRIIGWVALGITIFDGLIINLVLVAASSLYWYWTITTAGGAVFFYVAFHIDASASRKH
jgi:hypothetical protein